MTRHYNCAIINAFTRVIIFRRRTKTSSRDPIRLVCRSHEEPRRGGHPPMVDGDDGVGGNGIKPWRLIFDLPVAGRRCACPAYLRHPSLFAFHPLTSRRPSPRTSFPEHRSLPACPLPPPPSSLPSLGIYVSVAVLNGRDLCRQFCAHLAISRADKNYRALKRSGSRARAGSTTRARARAQDVILYFG